MKKYKACIIGAGNISNSKHIPAINKIKNLEIIGIVSSNEDNLSKTKNKNKIKHSIFIKSKANIYEQLKQSKWFEEDVDIVIIGTPPKDHFEIVKSCLLLKKHTLIEKPMMMSVAECDAVIELANQNNLILNVMHNFQFSNGIIEMEKRFQNGEFGNLQSILELQLTNRNRRLPLWYNNLPLGLFYDEAAHFFYIARKFGGNLKVINANAQFNNKNDNTPKFIQSQLLAGEIPVQMYMNFNSPICEWGVALLCDEKIAIYDFFKDILIVVDNDNKHLAKDVLRASLQFFIGFWKGFIKNGFKMISNNLLYGHDKTIQIFLNSVENGIEDERINASSGRQIVLAMNEVVQKIEEGKCDE